MEDFVKYYWKTLLVRLGEEPIRWVLSLFMVQSYWFYWFNRKGDGRIKSQIRYSEDEK
jgi:hypothetical protein